VVGIPWSETLVWPNEGRVRVGVRSRTGEVALFVALLLLRRLLAAATTGFLRQPLRVAPTAALVAAAPVAVTALLLLLAALLASLLSLLTLLLSLLTLLAVLTLIAGEPSLLVALL